MPKSSDPEEKRESLRDQLIGLGERSFRKSYYPQLQSRLDQLERFRRLLDRTLDAILLVALPSDRIVDANTSACRQSGYSREQLLAMTLDQVVDLDRLDWTQREDPGDTAKMVSTVLRRSDGVEVPVEVDLSMDDFGGSPYGIVVARDVSERRRAEASLQKSEWEKALILESTEELIFYLDADMRIVWANRAAGRSLPPPRDTVVGRFCWDAWHRSQTPCRNCPVLAALKTGRPQKGEITGADGRVWYIRGYPVRDEAGAPKGAVELCLDITERKKAEEALRESDRMKSEFISTAAHELRTPLTAIQGFSQLLLLQKDISPVEQAEFLSCILEKSMALSRILTDLLDISRAESGKGLSFDRFCCPASELVGEAETFFRALPPGQRLEVDLAAGDSGLDVDRGKVAEVFENLLSNAVKYSYPGGTVRILGRRAGEHYEFVIADQGIGMTEEQVERIFDKFYRVDASDTASAGLGLGMSLVRTIIEAHGGGIEVISRPEEGTTVRFTLPLARRTNEPRRAR
jgi:PAS domain S-box-containing protein